VEIDAGASSSAAAASDTSATLGGTLVLTRTDADEDAPAGDPVAVATDADLDAYARGVIASDPHVHRVDSSADHVALSYDERAWLLGFIPTEVAATARIDADGTASVSYPWYRFLMATDQDAVQASVDETFAASGNRAAATGSLSANAQARFLADLHAAMQAAYRSSAGTGAASSGTASAS
jgi:hypothetical protein